MLTKELRNAVFKVSGKKLEVVISDKITGLPLTPIEPPRQLTAHEAIEVIANVKHPRAKFMLSILKDSFTAKRTFGLNVVSLVDDTYDNKPSSVRFEVSLPMEITEPQLLAFAMLTVEALNQHESAEWFQYKSERPFNPHRPKIFVPGESLEIMKERAMKARYVENTT